MDAEDEYLKRVDYLRAYYRSNADKLCASERKRYEDRQEATRPYAKRDGTPWTPVESQQVLTGGPDLVALALRLGRSYEAVRTRRKYLSRLMREARDE